MKIIIGLIVGTGFGVLIDSVFRIEKEQKFGSFQNSQK